MISQKGQRRAPTQEVKLTVRDRNDRPVLEDALHTRLQECIGFDINSRRPEGVVSRSLST